ncbi:GNAT family N-acetyltransferase [Spirosoma endophyticum]|uniref:Ribosomal protein S18 acetylase RimI n=1 Tax=Spirosoma endophyticum TaxID=662367 RepID=A0A1I2BXA1_9BACT|nr:GNAT family N-acetyltransferase [Spirosoma endophyticum]SFE60806.1 Ribosomal protein S18 acetylase RimI [Spirosoma endophyticum]
MTFTFRNDQPDLAIDILREVGQWLAENDRELWEVDTLTPKNILDQFTTNNLYVMYADKQDGTTPEPAAVFILQWEDPLFWPDVPANTSGFIHKLAIRRPFNGQNLFATILDFSRDECLKRGIKTLQLETDATRPKLMQFYERHGFQPTYQRAMEEFGQSFLSQFYVLPL